MDNDTKLPKWSEIETAARALGVSEWAVRKWAERRRVPGKWHVPIIVQSKGRVSIKDFAQQQEAMS